MFTVTGNFFPICRVATNSSTFVKDLEFEKAKYDAIKNSKLKRQKGVGVKPLSFPIKKPLKINMLLFYNYIE